MEELSRVETMVSNYKEKEIIFPFQTSSLVSRSRSRWRQKYARSSPKSIPRTKETSILLSRFDHFFPLNFKFGIQIERNIIAKFKPLNLEIFFLLKEEILKEFWIE